jgi:hypothetical protein
MLQAVFATQLLYVLGNCSVKLSILERFRRITGSKERFQYHIVLLMALTIIFSTASFLLLVLSCTPVSLVRDPVAQAEYPARCKTVQPFFSAMAIIK